MASFGSFLFEVPELNTRTRADNTADDDHDFASCEQLLREEMTKPAGGLDRPRPLTFLEPVSPCGHPDGRQ